MNLKYIKLNAYFYVNMLYDFNVLNHHSLENNRLIFQSIQIFKLYTNEYS